MGLRPRLRWSSLWALPCTLVGVAAALPLLFFGARAARRDGVWEVVWRRRPGPWARALPFVAITLGEVVIATSPHHLKRLREHEREHVQQMRRWGVFFFLAYPLASLWQLLRGRRAYWDNPFEVAARRAESSAGLRLHT
jgi:hypothetical protein